MRKILGLIGILLFSTAVKAQDFATEKLANWHHWRGPFTNGNAAPDADPPTKWNADGQNIQWKFPLTGRGSATPVIWGNKIFILSAIKTDRLAAPSELPKVAGQFEKKTEAPQNYYKFLVTCLDRKTGQPIWERLAAEKVPHEGHHETHSYAAGSPTTDGQRLYVSFGSFGIYCYDLNGKLLWSRDLGRLNTRLGWGEAVSPVIHGDNLLLNWDQESNSALYCLDARTGETRWKTERDEKTTWTTPLIVDFDGGTQVILNGTTKIRSHDLKTGKVLWSCGGMTINPIPSALRFKDMAVIMSGYRGSMAVAVPLSAQGEQDPSKLSWKYGKGTPYVPSPVLVKDRIYFTETNTGLLTALDAQTGKPVFEKFRLPSITSMYASPIYAGGRLYFCDRAGTTVIVKPGDEVEVLAVNKLGETIDSSPVAVGKSLYLRGDKNLFCIETK
ncbi:PQQ-binding-like beta-propeller repeat protein [Telmatocola sphagniphila]|uniref:PQQ-binding-like beta-propeller repeat protein n=1 Tax=Telmatocola sphagniphila TaxID=1123043 RepID=UPI001FE8BD5E|nr:PQQ-binding-like beta-propeller repeat protein [Telmatocola sphagniphila]